MGGNGRGHGFKPGKMRISGTKQRRDEQSAGIEWQPDQKDRC